MELLIGVDIGTTNIKSAAYDVNGRLAAEASQPTPGTAEGIRRASIDPYALWQATAHCLSELSARLTDPGVVAGLAVASVGEAGVPLDGNDRPLYPIIAWYDERSVPQAKHISQTMGDSALYRVTGLPPGHTYTAQKLLWLQANQPEIMGRMDCWLAVSDWIAHCLGAIKVMGYSQASRTLALDLAQRRWWAKGIAELGLPGHIWPPLVTEGGRIGSLSTDAAQLTGLRAGTPLFLAGHDHVCGAFASGVTQPGIVLDSTGTTEAELTTIDGVSQHLGKADLSFCMGCHVVPGLNYATGGILGAGSLISWLSSLFWPNQELTRAEAVNEISRLAETSPHGANGLYLLPHLAGAGSPDRSSTARGVMAGLSLAHTRADLARAAIEGLAFELNALWDALERFSGQPISQAVTVGGGARNTLWNQIKADITGKVLITPLQSEAVTRGAAMLAGLGAGIYRDTAQALQMTAQPGHTYMPEPGARAYYIEYIGSYINQVRRQAVELGRTSGQTLSCDPSA